jgi:catechol 1,2-dioxygenase
MRRVTSLDEQLHPGRSERASLGSGFVITGRVRAVADCTPLEGVRVQVWLATETGGEQDNRASIRTGPDGRYRI